MDKHYWKKAYRKYWKKAGQKESFIQQLITAETGYKVEFAGLGAGSEAFIYGNATDNAHIAGDADLYIPACDAFVEVTGPNIPMETNAPLWIRPDKLNNTYRKLRKGTGKFHAIVHVLQIKGSDEKLIRSIWLNGRFYHRAKQQAFSIVEPTIRGRKERYVEILPNDECIRSFDELIELLCLLRN